MSTDDRREQALSVGHDNESRLLAPGSDRHWSGWLAALVLVVTFGVAAGPAGAGVGVAAVAVWAALGTPYAIAAGVALLVAVTPDGVGPIAAAVAATGLLALVLAPVVTAGARLASGVAVVLTTGTLGSLAWLVVRSRPLWLGAVVLVGAGAVLAYGLDRYYRLRLGLLEEQRSDAGEDRSIDAPAGRDSS